VFLVLLFLALLSGCSQAAPFHRAPDRHTLAERRRTSALPRSEGLDGGPANHDSRSAHAREILISRSELKAADGGTKPGTSGSCSVSSAPPRIAFQRVKGVRRTFQRGRLRRSFTGDVIATAQLRLRLPTQGTPTAYRQARLNSRNPTNIATACTHRQPGLVASDGKGSCH
jgi:hypothetical protein